ncbi:hypothetical protein Stube_58390 [Streptomyces tubercidicus]|uniref:Uncharacterized protein n=1 Tax=Streptomyces tubercidicus TaxID=47759 RepID=A0A640V4V8_9ACTN|nr:hypothetical protein Stube_58390 [Streptomyces tubercidicus]
MQPQPVPYRVIPLRPWLKELFHGPPASPQVGILKRSVSRAVGFRSHRYGAGEAGGELPGRRAPPVWGKALQELEVPDRLAGELR